MMTLKEKVIDAIECLKSCVCDENKKLKDIEFLTNFERGAIFGRVEGYERAIELLQYIILEDK